MTAPGNHRRLALIVPEYRTAVYGGGGLAGVADFAVDAFTDPELPEDERWDLRVISVRTHRGAAQHRRVLAPSTWFRGPVAAPREVDSLVVHDVGAHLGEFEPVRYLPRRVMTELLADRDVALVVAGSPALANVLRGAAIPVVLKVATLVEEERRAVLSAARGPAASWRRLTTALVRRLDERGVRLADAVIAMNPGMRAVLAAMTSAPVHLMPAGVDTVRFTPPANYAGDGPILMLGRLDDDRKNIAGLLAAYRHLRAVHGIDRRLVLAGRNGIRDVDAHLIHDWGLSDHVDVVADPTPTAVAELLRSAAVFALASHEEGLGLVLLEAMASGLPVVATTTRGAQFVVLDGTTGHLVALGDDLAPRFGDALALVLQDQAHAARQGAAGRVRVEERFSEEATRARWRELVTTTASTRSARCT